uniref:Uncharacterized protein n=1 Tax=Lepeophtheirus salmonis TaxID=72036 RepID=A0A0K2UAW0_LEPSM
MVDLRPKNNLTELKLLIFYHRHLFPQFLITFQRENFFHLGYSYNYHPKKQREINLFFQFPGTVGS